MALIFIFTAVVLAMIVIILLAILVKRQAANREGPSAERLKLSEAELASIREEKYDLQRRLAVADEKSGRIAEMERLLSEHKQLIDILSEAKSSTERQLATAVESRSHLESSTLELRERLASTEHSRDENLSRLDSLNAEKGKAEEMLAVKNETLAQTTAAAEELRNTLQSSRKAEERSTVRLELAAKEKSDLESSLARESATLLSKSEAIAKLTADLDREVSEKGAAQKQAGEAGIQVATLLEALDQEKKQGEEKLALLAGARESMSKEFKILAAEAMKSGGETLGKQNKEQIEVILTPLREKLGEFQLGLQNTQTESAKERATLGEQIRHLSERSAKMTLETSNLTRALKGEAQTQGAWGEMILSSILERSGLREGDEYVTQQSHSTEDGGRLRPDVVVTLPMNQKIVIDSKLSLVAFNEYVNAGSDAERASHLKAHLSSIRSHIKALSNKEYHSAIGSQLDYVVMFMPIEGALAVALQADPTLTGDAVAANVAIATPTTLMIALRTVSNVWQVERRNKNAETIADRAGKIYDKLVGFLQDMSKVGDGMSQARASYDIAMLKLSSGQGNLVRQVGQLKGLGAKTNKSIPANFLDENDSEILPSPEIGVVVSTGGPARQATRQ